MNVIYPNYRQSAKDSLWICDACGAAEWSRRRPAHECSARRDAWGKRAVVPLRPGDGRETALAEKTLSASA